MKDTTEREHHASNLSLWVETPSVACQGPQNSRKKYQFNEQRAYTSVSSSVTLKIYSRMITMDRYSYLLNAKSDLKA